MVTDLDGRRVISVLDGGTKESVGVVAMDMWRPYMDAAAHWLPNTRVCFDRLHVVRHLVDAVNTVRKAEYRRLRAEGGPGAGGDEVPVA